MTLNQPGGNMIETTLKFCESDQHAVRDSKMLCAQDGEEMARSDAMTIMPSIIATIISGAYDMDKGGIQIGHLDRRPRISSPSDYDSKGHTGLEHPARRQIAWVEYMQLYRELGNELDKNYDYERSGSIPENPFCLPEVHPHWHLQQSVDVDDEFLRIRDLLIVTTLRGRPRNTPVAMPALGIKQRQPTLRGHAPRLRASSVEIFLNSSWMMSVWRMHWVI
ncbi:hypothetical protein V8E54_011765 [Elaphomyces granulatus]